MSYYAALAIALLAVNPTDPDVQRRISELGSPSQETRDAAAEQLRATFTPTPGEQWEPLLSAIKTGDKKKSVLDRAHSAKAENGPGTGQSHMEQYRLDDCWMLSCWYRNADDSVFRATLVETMRNIWVEPPRDFSGAWVTYFVNGHKSHEIHYKNGKRLGTLTAYYSDGSKHYVQTYSESGVDGPDTGYFRSGRIKYRAQYKDGSPVGTWTWYDEEGRPRYSEEHPIK